MNKDDLLAVTDSTFELDVFTFGENPNEKKNHNTKPDVAFRTTRFRLDASCI